MTEIVRLNKKAKLNTMLFYKNHTCKFKDTDNSKMVQKTHCINTSHKKAGVAILTLDKVGLRIRILLLEMREIL